MQTVDLNIEKHMQTVKIISQINNEISMYLSCFLIVCLPVFYSLFMVSKSRIFSLYFLMYKQEGEEHLLSYL